MHESMEQHTASKAQWHEAMDSFEDPVDALGRRDMPRCRVAGSATVTTQASERMGSVESRCALLEASTTGLTCRSRIAIPMDTQVAIELYIGDEVFRLAGTVVHSTGTVGGFKIGIELTFPPEDRPPASRE